MLILENIMGAIARGYCSPENSKKILDPELILAMAKEVLAALPCEPVDSWRLRAIAAESALLALRLKREDERELTPPPREGSGTVAAEALRKALEVALTQNEHDMLMTGEECRAARAALAGINNESPK